MDEAWGNLVGMERPELLASVEEPKAKEEPSVIHRICIFVRLEAIRTEKHQTRFTPLQPYMDEKSISDHARPWKQMLMFFWQTQREHAWKSPKYHFTQWQRDAWKALVREAGGAEDEDEEDEEDEDEEQLGANSDEEITDDADSAVGEMEEEPAAGSITRKEYDSPLVCALAVLRVKEDGWKGAEQYPPILSAVIKVARFMIVQQALALSEPFEDDGDSAYGSDGDSTQQPARPKGCLQHVQQMMDKFMVHGSHSPMQ
ncbi:hypothetical protein PSPO01_15497 [Paraphaeosphaeria sporulosa]